MIFRRELAEKVMAGEKTVTRRLCSGNPRSPWWFERTIYTLGKEFSVQPGRAEPGIGRARVVSSERVPLDFLTDAEARQEGFADDFAFRVAWTAINGCYQPDAEVWRIEFEVIS